MAAFRFLVITAATVESAPLSQAKTSVGTWLSHGIRRLTEQNDMMQLLTACDGECTGSMILFTTSADDMTNEDGDLNADVLCANQDLFTCMASADSCAAMLSSEEEDESAMDLGAAIEMMMMLMCGGDVDREGVAALLASATVPPDCQTACPTSVVSMTAYIAAALPQDLSTVASLMEDEMPALEGDALMDVVCGNIAGFQCFQANSAACNMGEGATDLSTDIRCPSGGPSTESSAISLSAWGTVLLALMYVGFAP